jgi:pimeloyl-ACP methyl ester carboxylesterase
VPTDETLVVTRTGLGDEVLLVHGGASPAHTWRGLEPLTARWTLAAVHRRGCPPSPPPTGGRSDFAEDAADLGPLLATRPHVVAHSYGGVGALLAAADHPVRSLTLIEPAVHLLPGDPAAEHLKRIGETALAEGPRTDPATLREFLRIAGSPVPDEGPLPDDVLAAVRRAHGARSPYEAELPLDRLRDLGIPVLVVSGDHHPPMERTMDALAAALGGQRLVAPGAGHFVAAAPGFADELDTFLSALS